MTTQTRSLTGKGALVTGGSKGIGAAIVRRLASDGASVAITYLHSELTAFQLVHEIESSGGKALAIKADSASANELRAAVADARESLGRLDIFVSNAGILSMGTIETYGLEDDEQWRPIVLIGSNAAVRTAFPGTSVYSMTKAALRGLVRGAAIDLASRAITVNNIQPGPIATEMAATRAELVKLIPLKRMGNVWEVASFVSYLASEDAGFITGASLTIDGGYVA